MCIRDRFYFVYNNASSTYKFLNLTSGSNNTVITDVNGHWADGSIISIAYDADNGKLYAAHNGSWYESGDPANGTGFITSGITSQQGGILLPFFGSGSASARTHNVNFGNGYFGTTAISTAGTSSSGDNSIWEHDCPTGFYGLNTKNLGSYS